jgi:tetratricopeptide (TPR) repeat protein
VANFFFWVAIAKGFDASSKSWVGNMNDLRGALSQARSLWLSGSYQQAAAIYEQAIEIEPDQQHHYWHLGLMLLLLGQESDAQMAWLMAPEQANQALVQLEPSAGTDLAPVSQVDFNAGLPLSQILRAECDRQVEMGNVQMAWAIRQYLREFDPGDVNNLLQIVQLSLAIGSFQSSDLIDLELIDLLRLRLETQLPDQANSDVEVTSIEVSSSLESAATIDPQLLLAVLRGLLAGTIPDQLVFDFTSIAAKYLHCFAPQSSILGQLQLAADNLGHTRGRPDLALRLVDLCIEIEPENIDALIYTAHTYSDARDHNQAIAFAKTACAIAERSHSLVAQVVAHYALVKVLMIPSGRWQEAAQTYQKLQALLLQLYDANPNLVRQDLLHLRVVGFFAPYFADQARANRLAAKSS